MNINSDNCYGSDTSDEEEMEYRRQNLPFDEIFARLEARTLAKHREHRALLQALLKGAKSFAELLELHPSVSNVPNVDDIIIQEVRDLSLLEPPVTEIGALTELILATPTKSSPGFMRPTISSEKKKAAPAPSELRDPEPARKQRKKTLAPEVLRKSKRVKKKPDRYSP